MLTIAWHAGHVSLRPAAFCPGLFCVAPCRDKQLDGDIEMLSTTSRDDLVQETHGDDANFWRTSPVDGKLHQKYWRLFSVNHFSDCVLITEADLLLSLKSKL